MLMVILGVLFLIDSVSTTAEVPIQDFDYLTLAMEWPRGFCEGEAAGRQCVVPKHTTGWILHGLWPSRVQGKNPAFCNPSARFDYSKLKFLEDLLLKYWPNLLYVRSSSFSTSNKEISSFWRHQYEKHGTCSSSLRGFRSIEDYFSKSLQLLQKHNPAHVLDEAGIQPRSDPYSAQDLYKSIEKGYGVSVCLVCHGEMLSEVRLCLSKGLTPTDRPKCGKYYQCGGMVYYRPLLHLKTRKMDELDDVILDEESLSSLIYVFIMLTQKLLGWIFQTAFETWTFLTSRLAGGWLATLLALLFLFLLTK